METKKVMDRYFELSDYAGAVKQSFDELINLFSEDAQISSGDVLIKSGVGRLQFFKDFFERNEILKHLWISSVLESGKIEIKWAVAGMRKDNTLFALTGTDIGEVNSLGKITHLEIKVNHNPS